MKVLVTGGAGFIGSHTVKVLLKQGFSVRVLDNFSSGKKSNLQVSHENLEVVEGDIVSSEKVLECMKGVDACIHLAAQVSVPFSIKNPSFSCQQNILGFVNVLKACVKENVNRFVYASSAAVYGAPESVPLTEGGSVVAPLSPYGLEKKVNEDYALLFKKLYNMSSLGMRYFNVYGIGQDPTSGYSGVISIFISRLQQCEPIQIYGDGLQTRDFVYVNDVARANVAALSNGLTGVCNIASGKSITLLELVGVLEKCIGAKAELELLGERHGDIKFSSADISLMVKKLGLVAITGQLEGLQQLWDYHER